MWELDYKERCVLKNWCFWTVVLEKTLESPLDSKEIQPVHPKADQSWVFIGRIDVEAEAPILWPPDVKNWLIGEYPDVGKDCKQEEKGMTEDKMVGWHPWVWASSGKPGMLLSMGLQRVDTTERLNWTELKANTSREEFFLTVVNSILHFTQQNCRAFPPLPYFSYLDHDQRSISEKIKWHLL